MVATIDGNDVILYNLMSSAPTRNMVATSDRSDVILCYLMSSAGYP